MADGFLCVSQYWKVYPRWLPILNKWRFAFSKILNFKISTKPDFSHAIGLSPCNSWRGDRNIEKKES